MPEGGLDGYELACAKGHVYPLLLVRLALTWACEAHTSYRGIALIFASLRGVVAAVGPCAETIRLWLLRVGLFLLRRPLPRCLDWVFLVLHFPRKPIGEQAAR